MTLRSQIKVGGWAIIIILTAQVSAHAQLAVYDSFTESNTYWLTRQTDTLISEAVKTDTNTFNAAFSLTNGGGGGWYTPNASFLATLNSPLFAAVNQQGFTALFPGWQKLSNTSTLNAQNITSSALFTYQNAISDTQQQMSELTSEDFTSISDDSQSTTSVLHELQDVVATNLIIAQELQAERQQIATLTQVVATQASEILNSKAQAQATASYTLLGPGK